MTDFEADCRWISQMPEGDEKKKTIDNAKQSLLGYVREMTISPEYYEQMVLLLDTKKP